MPAEASLRRRVDANEQIVAIMRVPFVVRQGVAAARIVMNCTPHATATLKITVRIVKSSEWGRHL